VFQEFVNASNALDRNTDAKLELWNSSAAEHMSDTCALCAETNRAYSSDLNG